MSTSKLTRKVNFYEIRLVGTDRNPVNRDDWHTILPDAHARFLRTKAPNHTVIRNGVEYIGWAGNDANTTVDYLIIGKRRSPADNPGVDNGISMPVPLELEDGLLLVEPVYVIPVSGTPYIATIGSSGCPRSGAIAEWIERKGGYIDQDLGVSLMPVLRRDAVERLQQAEAATALTVKILAASLAENRVSRLRSALQAAKGLTDGDGTISLSISLGRHKSNRDSEVSLLDSIQELADLPEAQTAQARVVVPEGNKMKSETIDFLKDKLTAKVILDGDPNEAPTHAAMIRAMLEAISQHRSQLL
ncbi:DUF6731 family protein [Actinomyces bowdenii]|uniref:Uncharacterized protein n=1 Tax=Actinomyces bowdenii TaxID=131109 RepID=A0A3P1V6I8_9ACTO|nr:DUF6731 family protein [Actinomyces bowdenii]RRD29287.1 hypothetical protein EII10_07205 [Actinomyces bowdenii]